MQEVAGSSPACSTNLLFVTGDGVMKAETLNKPKVESKKESQVHVCGYCSSWCYQGEYLHHDTHCQRPDQHN